MPTTAYYDPSETVTLQHPVTGDDIPVTDRAALVKAWTEARDELRRRGAATREIGRALDTLTAYLVGGDALRADAARFARDREPAA